MTENNWSTISGKPTCTGRFRSGWVSLATLLVALFASARLSAAAQSGPANGSCKYVPDVGTILPPGEHVLTVTCTPIDSNHRTVTKTVTLRVLPLQAVVTWTPPTQVTYGSPLDAIRNATANVRGSFVYDVPQGAVLPAGPARPITVTFTPDDPLIDPVTVTASLEVLQADGPELLWQAPAPITYGTPLSAVQLNAIVAGTMPPAPESPAPGPAPVPPVSCLLTVAITPPGSGRATSFGQENTLWRVPCGEALVTAISNPGFRFVHWSLAGGGGQQISGDPTIRVSVRDPGLGLVATFAPLPVNSGPPPPLRSLASFSRKVGEVTLTWTVAPSSNHTSIEILRGGFNQGPPNLTSVATVSANVTTFTFTGCTDPGESIHWYARGVNSGGAGELFGPIGKNCDGSDAAIPGIYVSDIVAQQIVRVNPLGGATEVVSNGGLLQQPFGLGVLKSGALVVADATSRGVIKIDARLPVSHRQSFLSSGGLLVAPQHLAIEKSGTVLVTDGNRIIRIDPSLPSPENQTLVSSGGSLGSPGALAVEPDGTILVGNSGGNQSLVRVNPVTGAQTDVPNSTGCPNGMAVEANGSILFAGSGGCGQQGIFRITSAGTRTQLTSGDNLPTPYGMAVDATGSIIVVDPSAFGGQGGVVRVDPLTGAQTVISSGGIFIEPAAVVVVP
jgi:sugar lactone lactonase YvrE